jgi:hydrogenase maturation protein HypF
MPTDALFRQIVEGRLEGRPTDELAFLFHDGLARLVADACDQARLSTGVGTVALTGGCYQNLLLLDLSVQQLRERGFDVLLHSLVPPNDGGVALGQAVVAAFELQSKRVRGA